MRIYGRFLNIIDKNHLTHILIGAGNADEANGRLIICMEQVAHEESCAMQATIRRGGYELRADFFYGLCVLINEFLNDSSKSGVTLVARSS